MSNNHSIIFFIDDKLGGVSSLNYNLIKKLPTNEKPLVIHIDNLNDKMTRAGIDYPNANQLYFHTDNFEHRLHALKRLRKLVPEQAGAMILNYGTEMTMLDHFPVKQTTYQLVHDNFNLNLSVQYAHLVDVFICHNTHIQKELHRLLPHRAEDIYYLPHGIEIPAGIRQPVNSSQPLRLLFLGRMTRTKGVFDLPEIDKGLKNNGLMVEWGCIGSGPDLDALKQCWAENSRVKYFSPATNAEVMQLIAAYDVLVLPTKFEGSPVALIEAMSVGLVPVISRLPGGIVDIVDDTIGFTPEMDDNDGFIQAIIKLDRNRNMLEDLSRNCRKMVLDKFDLNITSKRYHDLFHDYRRLYKSKNLLKKRVGFRLDHPLIPPGITRFVRKKTAFFKKNQNN